MTDRAELIKKLQIKPGARLWLINAPDEIAEAIAAAAEVTVVGPGDKWDAVIVFAHTSADVEKFALRVLKVIPREGLLWFAYRKGAAAKASGLNRDRGWEPLRAAGWDTVRSISLDDDWTGLRFRPNDLIER